MGPRLSGQPVVVENKPGASGNIGAALVAKAPPDGSPRTSMRDYWLSKLFFDLQSPAAAAEYRSDQGKVLARYPLQENVKRALAANDVPFLAERTNAYLLRYYFFAIGWKDEEFIRRLRGG